MKRSILTLIVILIVVFARTSSVNAQDKSTSDSLGTDSMHQAAQSLLFQQQLKRQLDSLVKMNLQNELKDAQGDNQKTKELEDKLRQIEISDSVRKAEQLENITELKKNSTGHSVTLLRDTLFLIYTKTGSFNAHERASAISQRIQKLYEDPYYDSDSLRLTDTENGYDVIYNNETVIMSVNTLDALWYGKDTRQLAEEYLNKIKEIIALERDENSLTNWLKRIGWAALIIVFLGVLIISINKLFRWIDRYIIDHREKYVKGLTFRNIKVLTPEYHLKFTLKAVNILRIAVIILTIYLSLPALFSIFPSYKKWATTLLGWVLTPAKSALNGVLDYLPSLFTIIVIFFLFRYAIKGVKYFFDEIQKGDINLKSFHPDWAQPTFNIIRFLLFAFMVVLIFPYLPGSSSPAFQGISVFIGVLFSLGSTSAISNMVAGLVITYMRPFKVGDRVKIGEVVGDVMEKTMLVTRIRTIKNEDITVPNSTVLSSSTTNYSTNTKADDKGLIIHSTVTIGYDVPWKEMHKALIEAALRTDLVLKDPKPFVLQTSLDDFYVSYQINAYTKEPNRQAMIYSLLHQNIQDCCNEAGIEILSPHYRSARDGNRTSIPANYLPEDYKAPGFKIDVENDNDNNETPK